MTKKARTFEDKMKLENFKNRRLMLLRYVLPIFFFSNLYWLSMFAIRLNGFILIPFILMISSGVANWLVFKSAKEKVNNMGKQLKTVKYYFFQQGIVNFLLLIFVNFKLLTIPTLFPLYSTEEIASTVINLVLFLGIFATIFSLRKIRQIQKQTDKWVEATLNFENKIKN